MVCAALVRTALTAIVATFTSGLVCTAFESPLVIHKEGTSEYHRPWCPVVRDGKDVVALTRAQAEARGLKSHAACEKDPSEEPPTGTGGRASSGSAPRSPQFVYIDASKYYHREKCDRSVGPRSRVALEVAGKTRWPCPACRPPLRKRTDAPAVPTRGGR
jgi:hypothetical protein